MKTFFTAILFSLLTSACIKEQNMASAQVTSSTQHLGYTYLALGDSYTIGEAVTQTESFPYQLKTLLQTKNIQVANPKIIATTGWTTDELQTAIEEAKLNQKYDFVTLLIGVNNQYRGYSLESYKKEFSELLQTAINFADGNRAKVFVVSIPDWGVTPFGKSSGKNLQDIGSEIDAFNKANKEITHAEGIIYTDITAESRKAKTDQSLIATDGLHPSAKMYTDWANALLPKVESVLK